MMRKNRSVALAFLLILIISCSDFNSNLDREEGIYATIDYPNGNTRQTFYKFPNKEIIRIRSYYDDGVLKKIQDYKSSDTTTKHGTYSFYYPEGQLQDTAYAENGRYQGKRILYYRSGDVKEVHYYNKGMYRSALEYFENGNPRWYGSYSHDEYLRFSVSYDSNSTKYKYQGSLISGFSLLDTYRLGDDLKFEILVAQPPDFDVTFNVDAFYADSDLSKKEYRIDELNRVVYSLGKWDGKEFLLKNYVWAVDTNCNLTVLDTLTLKMNENGYIQDFHTKRQSEINYNY